MPLVNPFVEKKKLANPFVKKPLVNPFVEQAPEPRQTLTPIAETAKPRPDFVSTAAEGQLFDVGKAVEGVKKAAGIAGVAGQTLTGETLLTLPKMLVSGEKIKERAISDIKEIAKPLTPRPAGTPEERARAIAEITGKPFVAPVKPRKKPKTPTLGERVESVIEKVEPTFIPEIKEGERGKEIAAQVGSTLGRMAGAGLSLPLMAGSAGLEKAEQSLEEGEPLSTALTAGATQGAIELATEWAPTKALKTVGTNFIKRLGKGLLTDVPGELAATAGEMFIVDEKIRGKEAHTQEEYEKALWDTLIVSGLVTGAATTAVTPFTRPAPEQVPNAGGAIPIKETDTPAPTAWEQTQERARAKSKEVRKTTLGKVWKNAVRGTVDVSGNIQAKLKALGPAGQEVVWRQNAINGAPSHALYEFEQDTTPIYGDLAADQKVQFDNFKSAMRAREILTNRPGFAVQEGHTIESIDAYLNSLTPELRGQLDAKNELYKNNMDKLLNLAEEHGLRTKKQNDKLRATGREYLPREILEYVDPEVQQKQADGRTISVRDSGIKMLTEKGTEKLVETDSRYLMEQAYMRTYARIYKNLAAKELANLVRTEQGAKDLGLRERKIIDRTRNAYQIVDKKTGELVEDEAFESLKEAKDFIRGEEGVTIKQVKFGAPIFEKTRADEMSIAVMEEGKRKEIIMPVELGKEWTTGDPILPPTLSGIIGWASGKKILQSMATTLNPEFVITNIPRDLQHIWLSTEEYSPAIPKAALQMGADIKEVLADFKGFKEIYIKNGGGMEMLSQMGKLGLRGHNAVTRGLSAAETVMSKAGEFSEIVTRLALMNRAKKNGATDFQATQIARGYLDFARGGSAAKAANSALPFFNAAIQGTRGVVRAAKKNPKLFTAKALQIGAVAYGLSMANMSLWGEDYEDVPDFDKDNYWIMMTPYTWIDKNNEERRYYVRIAKDQGQRTFAKIFENMARKQLDKPVDTVSMTKEVANFLPIIPGELLPPVVEMTLGYAANKDFWLNEDIWKGDPVIPEEEYTKYTPKPFVKAGEITGLSPVRLQNAAKQLFTSGNMWTSLAGYASKQIFDEMTPEERAKVTNQTLDKYPVVRKLLRSTRPDLRRKKVIKEENMRINTERLKLNREFDAVVQQFAEEQISSKEVMGFVNQQEVPERKRLINRFKKSMLLKDVTNKGFWFDLMQLPPEARAVNYWNERAQKTPEEQKEMDKQSFRVPGLRSGRFNRTFIKMKGIEKQSKEQNTKRIRGRTSPPENRDRRFMRNGRFGREQ
jgi:hypothetical protein